MMALWQQLVEIGGIALTFFLVANPIGNSPAILAIVKDFPLAQQKRILRREAFFALLLAFFFQYCGKPFLDAILVQDYTVALAGGVLLMLVALEMIFPHHAVSRGKELSEPYFVPIATPLVSGPGLLTIIMLYSQQHDSPLTISGAILLAWVGVTAVMVAAPLLNKLLRRRGLIALEQLMGMLLLMIGLEMAVGGLKHMTASLAITSKDAMDLFTVSLILFLIMDPFGNVGSFHKALSSCPPPRRRRVALREMAFALLTMLAFALLGEALFHFLQLSAVAVSLAAGLVLFLTAIKILFGYETNPRAKVTAEEPYVIPLAIPLIAGPSLLATIMLFAHMDDSFWKIYACIGAAWLAATAVVLASERLLALFGYSGLAAIEKLMGMVLVLLALQRLAEGALLFIQQTT